ncbi:SET domain-containing protein [Mollisia scopiformis]|uniref:SET domain-containing protein n=1 Tax=Mollisia scopiformis TaxID=149040 RepID=A0A132B8K4_MOLSC|nr:SET domain-containing protein [Mollisia scopiformis]KUJ07997.1 SET domain-containing protein [Mollisia scopiformis]
MAAAHLVCHENGLEKYAEEEKRCHYCQFRRFSTHYEFPISINNDVDNEGLPESFQFVNKVVPSADVPLIAEEFVSSCECVADHCVTQNCTCLSDIDASRLPGLKKNAYHATGQLRSAYLNGHYPIYECGDKCKCGQNCPNRVVQRGRTVCLQIFKTDDGRGWGVKTLSPIIRGYFVDCYFGELLTPDEAQARRDQASSVQQKDVYLFALDKFTDIRSPDPRLHAPYEIDGEFISGPTRFINHSCDPNLRIFAVVKNSADQPFHSLAFFALENIAPNTELTFDYLDGITGDGDDKEKTKCLCGAENCRGYLF